MSERADNLLALIVMTYNNGRDAIEEDNQTKAEKLEKMLINAIEDAEKYLMEINHE